jgi:surface antigen
MMPLLLKGSAVSFKKELWVVFGVLGVLVILPIISIVGVTDVSALAESGTSLYTDNANPKDTYDYGFCTYWAALRRIQVGQPIPNMWGNANTWDDNARAAGYFVDHTPAPNAIMQTDAGPLGHVAFVESVGSDGSWTISEMNFKGWDEVDSRTLPATAAKQYNFIH